MSRYVLGLDIGSNSVGSVWIDRKSGEITTGVSVFPAGVDEADDKRGEPKNAKRRMMRRTRITLARRAQRKRALRMKLIEAGLLPKDEAGFKELLETTDPWMLRRKGLDEALSPHELGRVLLHLAQRRGALGLKIAEPEEGEEASAESAEDGKVKAAIGEVRVKMRERDARTFGEFIAMVRDERITPIESEDKREPGKRRGRREWRGAVRNKAASYEHCADRAMIRHEFGELWKKQSELGGETAALLTDDLRLALDNPERDGEWRHKGLLFGQRATNWDLGTLGRCVLEPSERCAPHADMYASRYRVIEAVNNLRIMEAGKPARPLTGDERGKILDYLSGPLGEETRGKRKGEPKRTVSITDLRRKMAEWYGKELWRHTKKDSPLAFKNEFSDEDRAINTDWFAREIVHGAIGNEAWTAMPENLKEGFNRAILRHDPDEEGHTERLRAGVMKWGGLDEARAEALVAAWRGRPRPDAKRLNMSRRAVRNLLTIMENPWPDEKSPTGQRWPTQIEARKAIAGDAEFRDATTGEPLDDITRRRYATGAKGATARDRYYMHKHILMKDGKPVIHKSTGEPLAEPPPAPLISNPVVRKAIHEVRRHVVEYMLANGRKPDEVYIELAREAKMGKKAADRLLFRTRLRNRIRKNIIETHGLDAYSSTQQQAAVDRVVLCLQQDGVCPLCGNQAVTTMITPRMAASPDGGCEIAHIIPRASGGHNGLSNIVLAHTKCNRNMGRRTPREFWNAGTGFETGMRWAEGIYGEVKRPKPSEMKNAEGPALWACYFNSRDDRNKLERFKADVSDQEVQGFTNRQAAATTYAARQVMAYLSDALFDGKGLPERATGSGDSEDARKIFASNGLWTSRLRREWRLFFDGHGARAHGLDHDEERERKEKNRGDHHHHAIDAVVVDLGSRQVQWQWEQREKAGDAAYWKHVKTNSSGASYEDWMENYRRQNPLRPPAPFEYPGLPVEEAIKKFRSEIERAVFGENGDKPICHRPVKRKLIGVLHKATQYGPVIHDSDGRDPSLVTVRIGMVDLKPAHLRVPGGWDELSDTLNRPGLSSQEGRSVRQQLASLQDPVPGPGLVRDRSVRDYIRRCLRAKGLDLGKPDASNYRVRGGFKDSDLRRILSPDGSLPLLSGIPMKSVVLLRTFSDPVVIPTTRWTYDGHKQVTGNDPSSLRIYDGQNNHHIEIRVNDKGKWSGVVITGYEVAQRKLAKLRAFRNVGLPKPEYFRDLKRDDYARWQRERTKWRPAIAQAEAEHPLVDRSDNDTGRFVMSLCEGEMLWMKHKQTGKIGYFVVAEIEKPKRRVVLVPHWDARKATGQRDSNGKKIPGSQRDEFTATMTDIKNLAPPGEPHARKVRVNPLGEVTVLNGDL